MNEEEQENPTVFRHIMTVDGDIFGKFYTMEGAIQTFQQVAGTTNDEIEIHTIH